jgi:hypothetical protein
MRKISFRPTSRRSSHAQPGADRPTGHLAQAPSGGVSPRICPGGKGFRHPQDEDSYIPNIAIAPSVIPGTAAATAVNHYGLLRATEEMLGLPLLGNAAGATSLRTVFHI